MIAHISRGMLLVTVRMFLRYVWVYLRLISESDRHLKLSAAGRAVTSGLSGLDKRKSWLMSNGGDVAWRYRWGGWGLARNHTDKRGRQSEAFRGGGGEKQGQRFCFLHYEQYFVLLIVVSAN